MPNIALMEGLAIGYYAIVLLALVELLYSRPPGWGWWVVSILFVPLFAVLSLIQAPKSIAYRRRINQMRAAKDGRSDVFS